MAREKWLGEDGDHLASSRLHWTDPLVLGLQWVAEVSKANTSLLMGARLAVQAHYNADVDVENFHEDAALEIESLVTGDYVTEDDDEED